MTHFRKYTETQTHIDAKALGDRKACILGRRETGKPLHLASGTQGRRDTGSQGNTYRSPRACRFRYLTQAPYSRAQAAWGCPAAQRPRPPVPRGTPPSRAVSVNAAAQQRAAPDVRCAAARSAHTPGRGIPGRGTPVATLPHSRIRDRRIAREGLRPPAIRGIVVIRGATHGPPRPPGPQGHQTRRHDHGILR